MLNRREEAENPLPTGSTLHGVWGTSGTDVFAVGDAGTILHYNGTSWSSMSSGTTEILWGVCGSSGDVFAVVGYGSILHCDGNWDLNWEAMRELPAGCCVAQCDGASDIFKA